MAATVDNKSDVSRQLGDDQENELLTAEEKEHSPTDPEKKEEVVEIEKDGSIIVWSKISFLSQNH